MRASKTHWLRNSVFVMIVFLIAGTVFSVLRFQSVPKRTYAQSKIQFSFDGAASGIAPNGESFDITDIWSDSVLNKALADAGMEGRYTAAQIRGQLEIEGDYPHDINEQLMTYESLLDFNANRVFSMLSYHPTLFSIRLYSDFDKSISPSELENLLQCITASYEAHFGEVYSYNAGSTQMEYDLSEYDYPQQLAILSQAMNQTVRYADHLYEQAPSFLYGGYGFNSISVRLNNLINNEISNLSGSIAMNATTKNVYRLLLQYQYQINALSNQLEKQNECLSNMEKLIASYDKNEIIYLSTADSLTKIDGNSSETYDTLMAKQKEISDDITQTILKKNQYIQLRDDLLKGQAAGDTETSAEEGTSGDEAEIALTDMSQKEIEALVHFAEESNEQKTAAVETRISALVEKYQAIMEDLAKMVSAYNDTIINDSTVQIGNGRFYAAPGLLSSQFIVTMIKTAGPFCCVGLMICLAIIIADRKKKLKLHKTA